MTSIDETIANPLPNACVRYDDTDLSKATYFELRPVSDGEYTCSSYFYGEDSNYVQIRMGRHGRPCELIAKYSFENASLACRDFFQLAQLQKPLWYSGNDTMAQVSDVIDLVLQVAEDRFDTGDAELQELFDRVGLHEDQRAIVLTRLHS